jgi:SAM-dependent methyltransferase
VGCDPVPAFVEFARENLEDTRASFVIGGSGGLPRRAGGYDCVSSLCALNFFPDAPAALREMQRLAAHHGNISACVWDYGGKMEFLRLFWDAAVGLDQDARQLDEGVRFPLCQPDALMELFSTCGLHKVRCEALEIPTAFASFDDYWRPLLGGTGPAPSYVASIDDERRAALARKLEQVIPRSAEGRILLTARAWALEGLTD